MLTLRHSPVRHGRGFMLVEVLVTIVIFTIGLLGVIGLQTLAMSSSHLSSIRSTATNLAADMADRMRANLGAVNPGAPATYATVPPAANACRAVYAGSVEAAPTPCTPAELAADDLRDWLDQLDQALPGGAGTVCIDSTPDDGTPGSTACDNAGTAYAVKVWWRERATQAQDVTVRRFVTTVRP